MDRKTDADQAFSSRKESPSAIFLLISRFIDKVPELLEKLSAGELDELLEQLKKKKGLGEYGLLELITREQLLRALKPVEKIIDDVYDPEMPDPRVGKALLDLRRGTRCHILPPHDNNTSGMAYYAAYTYMRPEGSFTNGVSFSESAEKDSAKLAAADVHEAFHQRQYLTIPATSLVPFNTNTNTILTPLHAVMMEILFEAPTSAFEVYMSSMMKTALPGVEQVKNTITGADFADIRRTSPSLSAAFEKAAFMAMEASYTRDDVDPEKRVNFLNYYAERALKEWIRNFEFRLQYSEKAPPLPFFGELTTQDVRMFGDIMGVKIFPHITVEGLRSYVESRLSSDNLALMKKANDLVAKYDRCDALTNPQPARLLTTKATYNPGTLEDLHRLSIAPALIPA